MQKKLNIENNLRLSKIKAFNRSFYTINAIDLAKNLLGKWIIYKKNLKTQYLQITETEAYLGSEDLASHARFGKTKRNEVLFQIGGVLYIYMIYGIYFMLNIVSSRIDDPQAVLIRKGNLLVHSKDISSTPNLLKINGPGKICQVLDINQALNKTDCTQSSDFYILPSLPNSKLLHHENENENENFNIYVSKRIGISYAKEWKYKLLRFYI